jgi:hypothetical protein
MNYYKAYKLLITSATQDADFNENRISRFICLEREEQLYMEQTGEALPTNEKGEKLIKGFYYGESDFTEITESTAETIVNEFGLGNYIAVSKDPAKLVLPYIESMDRVLDKGIVYNDCSEQESYVLSNVETYLKYFEAVGASPSVPYSCYTSVESYLKAQESAGPAERDSELFLPSVEKLLDLSTIDERITDKGIVESGDWSIILNLIKEMTTWAETQGVDINVVIDAAIERILDKGIAFSQIDTNTAIIASIETYLKAAEAVGNTGPVPA